MGRVRRIVGLVMIAAALVAAGCGSDRDPNQRLSSDEGAALLREIRSDRGRMGNLTPAEREYLGRTLGR